MARCEDFPCCGHESGCCPDYDESGRQLNMRCVCGAAVPVDNRYSICDGCLSSPDEDDPYGRPDGPDEWPDAPWDGEVEEDCREYDDFAPYGED